MIADGLMADIASLIAALGVFLTAAVAVCKHLKLKRTARALEAVTDMIEAFDPHEQSIDDEGTVTIDPKKNLKRAISDRTEELELGDVIAKALKK